MKTVGELRALISTVEAKTGRYGEAYEELRRDFHEKVAIISGALFEEQGILWDLPEDTQLSENAKMLADELSTWFQKNIMDHV